MSEAALAIFPEKYYEEAKEMLKKKDFVEFISKVSIAIEVSKNDHATHGKALYLKAKGLMGFNQHSKALECIEEALKFNTGVEAFSLKRYKGTAKGYLGQEGQALTIFKELTKESQDIKELVDIYINIAWVLLSLKKEKDENSLEEVKHYLDLARENFEILSDQRKWILYNNYSVYYFYKGDYDQAIEMLESAIEYCEEKDLPDVYNNLAEMYLKIAEAGEGDIDEVAHQYLEKAEVLAIRYKNHLALGYIFYTKAMIEVQEDQLFTALDTLYLSFEYFKDAEAPIKACDALLKINELMSEYKHNNLQSLRENLKNKLKDTPYYEKI